MEPNPNLFERRYSVVVGIDPGTTHSAVVALDKNGPLFWQYAPNDEVIKFLQNTPQKAHTELVIEAVANYGFQVGYTVFETCVWTGRFMQAALDTGFVIRRLARRSQIIPKLGLPPTATDATVRKRMIELYGIPPGLTGDMWSALAIAHVGLHYPEIQHGPPKSVAKKAAERQKRLDKHQP